MENIYDIRKEKQLLYILQENIIRDCIGKSTIAIVINLYYEDTVEYYLTYIDKIPKEIDVYVISSRKEVLKKVEYLKRKVFLLEKDNRGRDISALLVAFKKYCYKYQYFCFLHDKKSNHERWDKDADVWVRNLWGNTIGSEIYINNVIDIFEENSNIGLLVPPEPIGEYYNAWYGDIWYNNFENTRKLAKELELNCDIILGKMPITIGTVFWAKTKSLNKLLDKDWKYEDFPLEPMEMDGTISHAIERILGYVVQDAGYDTGTIMSKEYATWLLLYLQDNMRMLNRIIENKLGVHTLHQLEIYEKQEQKIKNFCEKNDNVYIYGAGVYGKCILQMMRNLGYFPQGFIVGKGRRNIEEKEGVRVYELDELSLKNSFGIIIAVDFTLQTEIEKTLNESGIKNYIEGVF